MHITCQHHPELDKTTQQEEYWMIEQGKKKKPPIEVQMKNEDKTEKGRKNCEATKNRGGSKWKQTMVPIRL